jgi:hypothetical protein
MAIGSIPPWLEVSPQQFVHAGQAGAEAGLGAARTALEAESIRNRAAEEGARLSQAERLHVMEMQTREEIAQQNQLREQQKLALENAYKTAQFGLSKARLQEVQTIADQKAHDAAMQFADEQGFTKELAAGTSVPEAMSKYPRTRPSIVNALRLSSPSERAANIVTHPELPGFQFLRQPSGQEIVVKRPEHGLSDSNKIGVQKEIARLQREKSKFIDEPEQAAQIDEQIKLFQNILKGPSPEPAATPGPSPEAPLGWEPTPSGDAFKPVLPPAPPGQPAATANPYKVGARYQTDDGVMKYKGGDPNDERSWEKQ